MRQLHIARALSLPLDAVTQKIAILGTSGSGKSYCMTKLAEQMLDAKAQVVIIDPKSEAWGLRLKADGKTPAYDIPVLGGDHGDAPLRPDMGARVAELIVANDYSMILDVAEFIPQEWAQFCYEFGTRLLQLKKQKKSAMCLMIDEAHDFIPQNPDEKGWVPKMLGAMQRLQKLGRALGIGMTLASQRPQEVSKKALNLCELWINFQLVGTHERDVTVKTIGERDREAARDLDLLLPTLEIGHAYIWSPRWLKVKDVYHVLPKVTFDSSATPEVGAKAVEPRKLSPVDLAALEEDLRDVIEEAERQDPEKLNKQIAQLKADKQRLERELTKSEALLAQAEEQARARPETVEVSAIKPADLKRIETAVKNYSAAAARIEGALSHAQENLATTFDKLFGVKLEAETSVKNLTDVLARVSNPGPPVPSQKGTDVKASPAKPVRAHMPPPPPRRAPADGDLQISKTQQRILDALAFYESIGNPEPTNLQVGAIALIDATGGHFSNVVGPLSSNGLIQRADGRMRLTEEGRAVAEVPERVATLDEYHDVLRARVRRVRAATPRTVDILNAVIRRGGAEVSNEEIGEELGIDHTGGHFSNTIGPLGTLGLIRRNQGKVYPTEILFPPGLC